MIVTLFLNEQVRLIDADGIVGRDVDKHGVVQMRWGDTYVSIHTPSVASARALACAMKDVVSEARAKADAKATAA